MRTQIITVLQLICAAFFIIVGLSGLLIGYKQDNAPTKKALLWHEVMTAKKANEFVKKVCGGTGQAIVFITGEVFTWERLYQAIEPCLNRKAEK